MDLFKKFHNDLDISKCIKMIYPCLKFTDESTLTSIYLGMGALMLREQLVQSVGDVRALDKWLL